MPGRYKYDLSHQVHTVGDVGCLQTISHIPVVAGDSIGVMIDGVFRLAPLRRNMTMDAKITIGAWFVPHRHVYGDDWINFIKQGVDETVTLAEGPSLYAQHYLGLNNPLIGPSPKWITAGYNRIWNRYWRIPTRDEDILSDTYRHGPDPGAQGSVRRGEVGVPVAKLKTIWNTGVKTEVDADDHNVDINVLGSTGKLDIIDLEKTKARLRTERDREWFGQRYSDVMDKVWGAGVNVDADERPTLLGKNEFYLSGYDVDGTGDASIGQYVGKSAGLGGFNMPKKYFNEHGVLWIMAVLRFPSVHIHEQNYLDSKAQPTYLDIAGDPDIIGVERPKTHVINDFVRTNNVAGNVQTLNIPAGQHYRYNTNRVHPRYDELKGYMFQDEDFQTQKDILYVNPSNYDDAFQTDQLRHWNASMNIMVDADRPVPGPLSSVYAGSK